MFKSTSTSMILLGILAIIVGIIAIAWPNVTILALVILFAISAFMAAGLAATRAFTSRTAGPVFGYLLLALIDLAAGVVALVWPGPTAYVLVIIVAAWALVAGLAEFFAGFGSGRPRAPARCSSCPGWYPSRSASCCSPAPTSARSPWPCCSACTA